MAGGLPPEPRILSGHKARAQESPCEWPSRTGTKPGRQDAASPRFVLQSMDRTQVALAKAGLIPDLRRVAPATHTPQVFPVAA